MVLYPHPLDADAFDRHYFEVHVPLVEEFANLRNYTLGRDFSPVRGDLRYHLVAELDWDDLASLREDFASDAGVKAGLDAEILNGMCPGMHSMIFDVQSMK